MPKPEQRPEVPAEGEIPLGTKIRARRWFCGMTATELAAAAGDPELGPFDRSHVAHVELGTVRPSESFLEGVARALEIPREELVGAARENVLAWLGAGPPQRGRAATKPRGRRGQRRTRPQESGTARPTNAESELERTQAPTLDANLDKLYGALARLPAGEQQLYVDALVSFIQHLIGRDHDASRP